MPLRWLHKLRNDTLSGLQLFQLLRYGSLFSIAIILPQTGITAADIGLYESFLFFAGIVTFFWLTGLIQGMLPLVTADHLPTTRNPEPTTHNPQPTTQLFNASFLLFIFSLAAALVLWFLHPFLQRLLKQELPTDLLGWIVLYIILSAAPTVTEYWYVITNRSKTLLHYGFIAFIFQLLSVGLPAIIWKRIDYIVFGLILAALFRFIWMMAVLIREAKWSFNLPYIRRHLRTGMPIAASVLLSGSAQYVDGFIVTARYNPEVFAVFRYGARELPLVALLAHALSNAMVPVFKREGIPAALKKLKERSTDLGKWMFPLTLILILSSYSIFPVLFRSGFMESAGVFNLYLLLITSRLLFPQTMIVALEKTGILMWASMLELLLNVALSLLLVQIWGIRGVALATVLAYAFERTFLMVYLRVVQGIRVSQYVKISQYATWSLLLIAGFLISEFIFYPLLLNN